MKHKIGLLTLFLVSLFTMVGMASALPVELVSVEIDDDELEQYGSNEIYDFDKNQDLEVKVRVKAQSDVDNVQIEAAIRGYDHDDLMEDITDVFDMKAGRTYTKKLSIPLRLRMDQDQYKLRVRIEDRDGQTSTFEFNLEVGSERHQLMIKDIILSPENEVKAGRALLVAVRLKNYGEKDEEGIKIKASIPALGVSATDYIDELEREERAGEDRDDATTSEELYMRIPQDAESGDYDLRVEVTYDDGDETEVKTIPIRVVSVCDYGDEVLCPAKDDSDAKEKTIITLAADKQAAAQGGAEVVYPITITNQGSTSRTYIVSADGADWASFRVSPSNVLVVDAGDSKAVNVYVAADADAPVGEQTFVVSVSDSNKVLKEIPMKVDVEEGKSSGFGNVKRGLEVALIVLVVLLVILALVIGFNKLKGDEEEAKEDETYY